MPRKMTTFQKECERQYLTKMLAIITHAHVRHCRLKFVIRYPVAGYLFTSLHFYRGIYNFSISINFFSQREMVIEYKG